MPQSTFNTSTVSPFALTGADLSSSGRLSPVQGRRLSTQSARLRAERAAFRLAEDDRVRLVFLFGSAVDPPGPTVGDVDLAIVTAEDLSLNEFLELRADVVDAAGDVDLVSLNEASIVLCWEVARSGVCLYAAEADEKLAFILQAQRRYWDFRPFLDRHWELAGLRIAERRRHGIQT